MKSRIWMKLFSIGTVLLTSGLVQAQQYDRNPLHARYGNWGGVRYSNGADGGDWRGNASPVDKMDALFQAHDQAYGRANENRTRCLQNSSRPRCDLQWLAAYRAANRELSARLVALPSLLLNSRAWDIPGGDVVPWSAGWRTAFQAVAAWLFSLLPPI